MQPLHDVVDQDELVPDRVRHRERFEHPARGAVHQFHAHIDPVAEPTAVHGAHDQQRYGKAARDFLIPRAVAVRPDGVEWSHVERGRAVEGVDDAARQRIREPAQIPSLRHILEHEHGQRYTATERGRRHRLGRRGPHEQDERRDPGHGQRDRCRECAHA